MSIPIGIEQTEEFSATGDLLTDVGGTLPRLVLSTPGMISVMEMAATELAREHLPAGHATVGFEVCVKHVGAAFEGSPCTVSARLAEVVEDRKLRFEVEVKSEDRAIGIGTHERRVVAVADLGRS